MHKDVAFRQPTNGFLVFSHVRIYLPPLPPSKKPSTSSSTSTPRRTLVYLPHPLKLCPSAVPICSPGLKNKIEKKTLLSVSYKNPNFSVHLCKNIGDLVYNHLAAKGLYNYNKQRNATPRSGTQKPNSPSISTSTQTNQQWYFRCFLSLAKERP